MVCDDIDGRTNKNIPSSNDEETKLYYLRNIMVHHYCYIIGQSTAWQSRISFSLIACYFIQHTKSVYDKNQNK